MAVHTDREAFIPYRRSDLVEICIQDGKLNEAQSQKFRQFCEILSAYYHVTSQQSLEVLKDAFAPFNPDADTRMCVSPTPEQLAQKEEQLVNAFEQVLQQANYTQLSEDDLQRAFESESLIPLKTAVDFDDYTRIVCYYRGDNFKTRYVKKFLRRTERTIDNLERVALLLKFKDEAYFEARNRKIEDVSFTPGKMYLYIYKDIPKHDLELLFPNVEVRMNWKDRLLFLVPAIGGAIPLLLKILPSILIIIGVLVLLTMGEETASTIADVSSENTSDLLPTLLAAFSVGATLGGFAVRQYTSYKKKQLQFLKLVSDTLFFKNLVTNQGVLYTLIDNAEEEQCKEIILVYYHLLTTGGGLSGEQLDDAIEEWMEQYLDARIDFDIANTLTAMRALQAPVHGETMTSLVQGDEQGGYTVLPVDEAKELIDYVWDNVFQYSGCRF